MPKTKAAKKKPEPKVLTPQGELDAIKKKLGQFSFEPPQRMWLNTGSEYLNAALGSREHGLAYGKMFELYGPESNGKTLVALTLAGMAQHDGATVGWLDLENSWDDDWARAQGLDPTKVYLFSPGVVKDEKGRPRAQSIEEVLMQVQQWMYEKWRANKDTGRIFLGVDSVANMVTDEAAEAQVEGLSMKTNISLSLLLANLLKGWVPLMKQFNAMVHFINQVRMKPGVAFGNPEYTTGGKALKHNCAVRARVARGSGGKIMQSGKQIGIRGTIVNVKNKTGHGSIEGLGCEFKAFFDDRPWKFGPYSKKPFEKDKKKGKGNGEGNEE